MTRVSALCALVACACLVTGCGGSSLQKKARKVVGDPRAEVVDVEEPELLNGHRVTVIVLKPSGATGLGCGVAQSAGDAPNPNCPRWSYEAVALNPRTRAYAGDWETSQAEVAAIGKARQTSWRFMSSFPGFAGPTTRCNVAGARAPVAVPGICAISVAPPGQHPRCVVFSEAWRSSPESKLRTRGWVVRVTRDGHVQSPQVTKHPPQPWAGAPLRSCSGI